MRRENRFPNTYDRFPYMLIGKWHWWDGGEGWRRFFLFFVIKSPSFARTLRLVICRLVYGNLSYAFGEIGFPYAFASQLVFSLPFTIPKECRVAIAFCVLRNTMLVPIRFWVSERKFQKKFQNDSWQGKNKAVAYRKNTRWRRKSPDKEDTAWDYN